MSERGRLIIEILRATRTKGLVTPLSQSAERLLREVRARESDSMGALDTQTRVRLAQEAVELGVDIESIVNALTWKDFEGLVATVLRENGFRCVENFRRRSDSSGMEIDVIGVRGRRILTVDAKMWGMRRNKASALAMAAKRQAERTLQLMKMLPRLAVQLNMSPGPYTAIPVIVTWLVEDMELIEGVPIVPIFRFNRFVDELESYIDLLVSYSAEFR